MRQVMTLGNLVGRIERLEIRCTRCPRRGRVMLDKLIAEHGAGMDLPQLGAVWAADCPKATSPAVLRDLPAAAGPANSAAARGQVEQRRAPFRAQSGSARSSTIATFSPDLPRKLKLCAVLVLGGSSLPRPRCC